MLRQIPWRGAVLAVLCLLIGAHGAAAREVRVSWKKVEGAQAIEAKDKAVRQAFVEAAFQDALNMLGASFPEARYPAFKEYLAVHAHELVQGYSEVQLTATATENFLIVDANVDKLGLERLVHNLRPFATAKPPAVRLELSGATSDDEQRIERLRKVSGVEAAPSTALDVGLVLRMQRTGQAWSGTLAPASGSPFVAEGDMETVWFGVWTKYFAGPSVASPPAPATPIAPALVTPAVKDPAPSSLQPEKGEMELLVQGWSLSDGAYALDRVFREWKSEVASATLNKMEMKAAGVVAVWHIAVLDKAGLDARLEAYCKEKGLTYSFAEDFSPPLQ